MHRYISIKMNDNEIYVEDLNPKADINIYIDSCKKRLSVLRFYLPKARWSITIEERRKKGKDSHFSIIDVETGEMQEQEL